MLFLGIAISLWPMIVPYHYTLWQAASSPGTQAFLLIGTLFLLPVILMYTAWSYWVFRGKARGDVGYHQASLSPVSILALALKPSRTLSSAPISRCDEWTR